MSHELMFAFLLGQLVGILTTIYGYSRNKRQQVTRLDEGREEK